MQFLRLSAMASLVVASAPAVASAKTGLDFVYTPHPPDVLAVGLVVSAVLGSEPAIGVGLQADYLSFDTEIGSEIGAGARGRGAYGRVQIYIPFAGTRAHMHYALGLVSLRGASHVYDESPRGGSKSIGYFYGARFGLTYRASASALRQTWGPEIEPFIGAGGEGGAWFWTGARFAPPLSDVIAPGSRSHGWELGPNVGLMIPATIAGTQPGTQY